LKVTEEKVEVKKEEKRSVTIQAEDQNKEASVEKKHTRSSSHLKKSTHEISKLWTISSASNLDLKFQQRLLAAAKCNPNINNGTMDLL
jgi:hypothetical protein